MYFWLLKSIFLLLGLQVTIAYHNKTLSSIFVVVVCGGELTAPTATFTSPNYPGMYPHSRRCEWLITVQLGRRVTLTFNGMNLEAQGTSCHYDYVQVQYIPTSVETYKKYVFVLDFVVILMLCVIFLYNIYKILYVHHLFQNIFYLYALTDASQIGIRNSI